MHTTNDQPGAREIPSACPDCRASVDVLDDGGRYLKHADSCPAGRSEDTQAALDAAWLATADPGAIRARPLSLGERVALADRLGPSQRRRAVAHVRAVRPGVLHKLIVVSGRPVAAVLSPVPSSTSSP